MRYPRFLSEGDRIGVSAPSFSVTEEDDVIRFRNGERRLRERGYDIVFTDDVFSEEPYTDPKIRASDMGSLFSDDSVRFISIAKGGETEEEILAHLDFNGLEKDPKWIQGYSDNTTLLFKITVDLDIATVYGSHFGDFGMEPWHRSVSDNLEFLEGKRTSQSSFPYHESMIGERSGPLSPVREDVPTEWISEDVSFRGRLIGGCMDILERVVKTGEADVPAFVNRYSEDGVIWYMETYDMTKERMSEMFSLMKKKGWFSHVRGFVFGRPLFYEGDYVNDVKEMFSDLEVPMVFGADVGHLAPRMLFINGAIAEFDVDQGKCTIQYEFK